MTEPTADYDRIEQPGPDQKLGVTVVIPAYRAEDTVCRAVDSALSQPSVDVRVVVVIDGLVDQTAERLVNYQTAEVTIIANHANKGAAAARNDGLAVAETEFVMFLDADDFVEGPLLKGLAEEMRKQSAELGFGPAQVMIEGPALRKPKFIPDFLSPSDLFRRWHLDGLFVPTCSVLWKTSYLRMIGGWDTDLSRNDDGELVMRGVLKGANFVQTAVGCGVYVKHSLRSLSNRTDNMDSMLVANERIFSNYSSVIDRSYQEEICGGHYFNIAWHCYAANRDDLGDEAICRSRSLGYSGSRGPLIYRIAFSIFGLKLVSKALARLKHFSHWNGFRK